MNGKNHKSKNLLRICRQILIIFLFASIGLDHLHAQSGGIRFEQLSIEEGLSSALVWDILQDSKGYMWFATGNGLSKSNR
jgi:ligand-binding sensor domain-containing protein